MQGKDNTWQPMGTVMDALLIRIRKQMDDRISADRIATKTRNTVENSTGRTQRRGVA